MKTQPRLLALLLVFATAWGCKKDSDTPSTPQDTPVLSLEERLLKGGLSFYTGLARENFQLQPYTKQDPANLLTEKNVADFEEALRRGRFKSNEVLGVKEYVASITDNKFNGVSWIVANVEKYPFEPTIEYSFGVVAYTVKEGSINRDGKELRLFWKRK